MMIANQGIVQSNFSKIVRNGLVFWLDAMNNNSYPETGTTWNDLSGNGFTATLTNGPTFNSDNGGSIAFDGVNDSAQTSTNVAFDSNPFSIDVWFKPSGSQTTSAGILCTGTAQAVTNWQLSFTNTGILEFRSGATLIPSTYTASNNWVNVMVVRETTETNGLKIYINSVFDTQGTAVNNLTQSTGYRIGVNRGSAAYYRGNIATVGVYNRALTPEEVIQNYNAVRRRFNL